MEVLALLVFLLGVLPTLMWVIPFHSWEFEFAGSTIKIRNYGLRETVAVSGVVQDTTRIGGNYVTEAIHQVVVSGRTLRIQVVSYNGLTMHCTAWEGDRILFTTEQVKKIAPPATSQIAPPATSQIAPPATSQIAPGDTRQQAALTLLDELARHENPRVVEAARRIREAFRSALLRVPLGNAEDEEEVEDLIETVRTLHVASTRVTADLAIDEVDDVLDQLDAVKEVSDLGRRRRAAHALKQKR